MSKVFIVLNVRDDTESKYPSIVFLSIQEVFHVYLNKFENAVTHLFFIILGNK